MRSMLNSLLKVVYGIFIAIFTIGVSVLLVLNSQFIYHYAIDKYNLDIIGEISKDLLKNDFNTLIKYLQNPFIEKLEFNNFQMRINGEFHFFEVKQIFITIYIAIIGIVLFFILLLIINKFIKKKMYIYNILNYGANTLICTIVFLLSAILINFSDAFIIFHKIFFNNEYWIFDEKTDPIIKVLPEEVFKIYALAIIVLVVLSIVGYKLYYYFNKYKLEHRTENSIKL